MRRQRRDLQATDSISDSRLEERCMMSADPVPIPASNPRVLSQRHLLERRATDRHSHGVAGVPSPADVGAMKTITITNFSSETIYPFLRTANDGKDPNDSKNRYYDPQDLHDAEFREYIGYPRTARTTWACPPARPSRSRCRWSSGMETTSPSPPTART